MAVNPMHLQRTPVQRPDSHAPSVTMPSESSKWHASPWPHSHSGSEWMNPPFGPLTASLPVVGLLGVGRRRREQPATPAGAAMSAPEAGMRRRNRCHL